MTGKLPPTASVATAGSGPRLHAPAAARNLAALVALLMDHAPRKGRALEIASGTGEHVVGFARALPGLDWQPSDIDPARLVSIDAHAADAGLTNLLPAVMLDAGRPGWSAQQPGCALVVVINLLHLIPEQTARQVLSEALSALAPGGKLLVYGPFTRQGALTSPGDRRFDAELRASDDRIGYKDDREVAGWLGAARILETVEMPANNLGFVATQA